MPAKPLYSRRALARLALSTAAAQLSDRARSRVMTINDSGARAGEFLDEVRSLLVAAEELLEAAVVFERERGTSWTEVGEVLGVSKQAAQQRYGDAVEAWTEGLSQSLAAADGHVVFTFLPGEGGTPHEHAARLDEWVTKSETDKPKRPHGKGPVSGSLEPAGLAEQIALLNRLASRMPGERDTEKVRAFHAAKAALLARLAKDVPEDEGASRAAADAQRELEALTTSAVPQKKARVISITEGGKKHRRPPA